ncbi:NAD(P)H-dependent oxidoreductase [Maricaulis sp.]|uniref:NAD(P)H-dependent oxidoreductase n=1 Tax=Maricaulis sp. TaxID=1486257 RepID=UPI003A8ECA81
MPKTVCVINGHPDPAKGHFVEALADAYAHGAGEGDHTVSRIDIAKLPIEFLRNAAEFGRPPGDAIIGERAKIAAADHIVFIYPLWMGSMPAIGKAFLEQVSRDGFMAETSGEANQMPVRKMTGKSVRLIVTMGMPGLAYRFIFGAHSVKAVKQGIFRMVGFKPVRHTILGMVGATGAKGRSKMLARVRTMGLRAR